MSEIPQFSKREKTSIEELKETTAEKETLHNLMSAYQQLVSLKGKTGADELLKEIIQGSSEQALCDKSESMVDLKKAKETALKELENAGILILSYDGNLLFDQEKLNAGIPKEILYKLGPIYNEKHLGNRNYMQTLSLLFKNLQAIEKEAYTNGEKTPKDLLYLPKTKEEALDINAIKKSKFHYTLYDFSRSHPYEKNQYGDIAASDLDFREVVLACLIYHPEYGNGYRDEQGRLQVLDKATGEYRPISSEYIQKNWGVFGPHKPGENFASPKLFVQKHLKHLEEAGLLRPEDFTVRIDKRNRILTERPMPVIDKKGRASFHGVHHMVGGEYAEKNDASRFKACQLSNELGGVITKNDHQLVSLFNLVSKADSQLHKGTKRDYFYASAKETQPRPYYKHDFFSQKNKETNEAYESRLNTIADLPDLLELTTLLRTESNTDILSYDFKQQLLVATLYKHLGKENMLRFNHLYGEDGLTACSALENPEQLLLLFTELSQINDPDKQYSARTILRKYNSIIQQTNTLESFLDQHFQKEITDTQELTNIKEQVQEKATTLLKKFSEKIKASTVDQLIHEIDQVENEIILLTSILKQFKDKKEKIAWETIKTMRLEIKQPGQELLPKEKEEILQIARDNYVKGIYKDDLAHAKNIIDELEHELYAKAAVPESIINQTAFMLKIDKKMIAFSKFRSLGENRLYASSLNVHPEAQQYSLGNLFITKILDKMSENHIIEAITRINNPANDNYERQGFIINKDHPFEKNGHKYYSMILDKISKKNSQVPS